MDPASIFALVEGAGGLALKSASLAKSIKDLASKYQQTRLTIISLVQGLDTIQLAWSRIEKWSQRYAEGLSFKNSDDTIEDADFFQRLEISLDCGAMIMEALEQDLLTYKSHGLQTLGFRKRTKALWNETTLRIHQDRINSQALAMTCLLQAIQLDLATERRLVLRLSEQTIKSSDESAYSIVPSRMSSRLSLGSFTSMGITSLRYSYLSFEDDLFTAKVYKRNYRTPQANRILGPNRDLDPSTANDSIVPSETTELRSAEVKNSDILAQDSNGIVYNEEALRDIPLDSGEGDMTPNGIHDRGTFCGAYFETLYPRWRDPDFFLTGYDAYCLLSNKHLDSKYHNVVETITLFGPGTLQKKPMNLTCLSSIKRAISKDDFDMTKSLLADQPLNTAKVDLKTVLHTAAHLGSSKIMNAILTSRSYANSRDRDGWQTLHIVAINKDRQHDISMLLSKGADIEARVDSHNASPLQLACMFGRASNVQALMTHGAAVNNNVVSGISPMAFAVEKGCTDSVCALLSESDGPLRHFPRPDIIILVQFVKDTLASRPNAFSNAQLLRVFRESMCHDSADSNRHDYGEYVFHYWVRGCSSDIVEELFQLLLHINTEYDRQNAAGQTPLHIAAHELNLKAVQLLLRQGGCRPILFTEDSLEHYRKGSARSYGRAFQKIRAELREHLIGIAI